MINIYTPKATPVQAIKYDGDNYKDVIDFIGDDEAFFMESENSFGSSLAMTSPSGFITIPVGSYITKNCLGIIKLYSQDEFLELFDGG